MSRSVSIIALSAPDIVNLPCDTVTERLVVRGLCCGYCKGQGEVLRRDATTHEWEYLKCPLCKGSGDLDADVTVEWKPRKGRHGHGQ